MEDYLTRTGSYQAYPGLSATVTVDGFTVRVALQVPFEPPVPVPGGDDRIVVHGTGSAVLPIYQ